MVRKYYKISYDELLDLLTRGSLDSCCDVLTECLEQIDNNACICGCDAIVKHLLQQNIKARDFLKEEMAEKEKC